MGEWLRNKTTLWLEDYPYSKEDFWKHIQKKTAEKKDGLYTLSGYISPDIYDTEWSYLDVAQKNDNGTFAPLWPSQSVHAKEPVIEISKRDSNGKLPKNKDAADKLDPSMVIGYQWATIIVPLSDLSFTWRDWFAVLKKIYPIVSEYLSNNKSLFDWSDNNNKNAVQNYIIKTMQEHNYIKAPLNQQTEKTIWWWKKRMYDVFTQLFGEKEGKKEAAMHVDE